MGMVILSPMACRSEAAIDSLITNAPSILEYMGAAILKGLQPPHMSYIHILSWKGTHFSFIEVEPAVLVT